LEQLAHGGTHRVQQDEEPLLNLGIDSHGLVAEVDFLTLSRDKLGDLVLLLGTLALHLGTNGVNTLEDLLDVLVDGSGVLGLTHDLKQIIVGQEEEAREVHTLRLQELLQLLLDVLQFSVLLT